jgi:hypothetical protein
VVNKDGDTTNAKDEFANFFETLAGFDFVNAEEGQSDFVYVHRLGLTHAKPALLLELAGE